MKIKTPGKPPSNVESLRVFLFVSGSSKSGNWSPIFRSARIGYGMVLLLIIVDLTVGKGFTAESAKTTEKYKYSGETLCNFSVLRGEYPLKSIQVGSST